MEIVAIVTSISNGYQYDIDNLKKNNINLGDRFTVSQINMGQSSTSIKLKEFDDFLFNSVNFSFEENGKPLNIYNDIRFNPYLKGDFYLW